MKYTVVWSDFFQVGSHRSSIVRICRLYKANSESWEDALGRYGLEFSQVNYLFEGWPKQDGEDEAEVVATATDAFYEKETV